RRQLMRDRANGPSFARFDPPERERARRPPMNIPALLVRSSLLTLNPGEKRDAPGTLRAHGINLSEVGLM
ncbi:hypothetical protein, partial [Sinorhizobium meliloti]|uniref:hypothetical protein n=1 Tax=Rhizobium meliloti TaxID=382 RepID=UPI001AEED081